MDKGLTVYNAIMAQSEAWKDVLLANLPFDFKQPILCVGSGTSFYLSSVIAHLGAQVGVRIRSLPTQGLILEPQQTLQSVESVMVISRSGTTSEGLWAAELARRHGKTVLGVTCDGKAPLASAVDQVWAFPSAHDHSVVMTRSFTAMLLAFERVLAEKVVPESSDMLRNMVAYAPDYILHS